LLDLQEEASTNPVQGDGRNVEPQGAQTLAVSSVLCGDFNFDDPQHALLQASTRPGLNYRDAWTIGHPDRPREPTCGVHDRVQRDGPDCRDSPLSPRIWLAVSARWRSTVATAASVHQPVLIEIAD
jgi:hypothetical protein